MASGGFKSSAGTDFLEEWKAKREKMRAKMLGDIAAITSANVHTTSAPSGTSNGNPDRSSASQAVVRSASSSTLTRRAEDESHAHVNPVQAAGPVVLGSDTKKTAEKPLEGGTAHQDNDAVSPKGKEKQSSGPSARKGKGQIEKRKLREKRRSTGVVSIPSNEVRVRLEALVYRSSCKLFTASFFLSYRAANVYLYLFITVLAC